MQWTWGQVRWHLRGIRQTASKATLFLGALLVAVGSIREVGGQSRHLDDGAGSPPHFGEQGADAFRCWNTDTWKARLLLHTSCDGIYGSNILKFQDTATSRRLANWVRNRRWRVYNRGALDPATSIDTTGLEIEVMNDARRLRLRSLNGEGNVIAHMYGKPNRQQKRRYGLDTLKLAAEIPNPKLTGDYYFVLDSWTPNVSDVYKSSVVASTWKLFVLVRDSVTRTEYFVPTSSSGKFRTCIMPHDWVSGTGAVFTDCITAKRAQNLIKSNNFGAKLTLVEALQIVEASKKVQVLSTQQTPTPNAEQRRAVFSLLPLSVRTKSQLPFWRPLSDQLWGAAARDESSGLAWMSCGGGCCTADAYE